MNSSCTLRRLRLSLAGTLLPLLPFLLTLDSPAALPAAAVEFFESRIRPVLAQDCYECHRTGGKWKAGLALDHRQGLLDGGDSGRVIVNRVWHHLFGRGLVATPDNFGRMGELPSHPELLDYLAVWFVEHRWSIKALISFIVTSETWQLSSEPPAGAAEKDPDNVLLSHASVRRLEAEAIRDTLLSVSGDLQADEMYGPPVLGGAPRRSVYLRVKRNDLDPFLAVFDAPVPAGPVDRRDVTNVPGQSLTLLNDPFVRELSMHWARRLQQDPALADEGARIRAMFVQAFGRPPQRKRASGRGNF